MECNFCHFKHMIKEESTHKKTCIPFLHDTIDKKESEKKKVERKREADKKQYDEKLEQMAKKSRTLELKYEREKKHLEKEIERMAKSASESRKPTYILTWNAKFPTPENHTMTDDNYYYTWNNHVGNLVDGTRKMNPRFKLDHGQMAVGLLLKKMTHERRINNQFYLTTGKKGRIKFNVSVSVAGKVLWQKETEELEVKSNRTDGWTGGDINDVLPSDLPSNLLVTVEVIEWEPNTK